jgi:hypothetical protein
MRFLPFLLAAAALGAGCNTVHTARPIGEGKSQVHFSLGGTMSGRGSADTPVPFSVVTYKYGVTDRFDAYVGWHVLETFVNEGNLWVDVGGAYYLLPQMGWIPGVSVAGQLSPLVNPRSAWMLADVQATASWALDEDEDHLLYTGFHNTLAPINVGVKDVDLYTWSPYGGYQARFFDDSLGLQAEVKWFRPYADNTNSVLGYIAPGDLGAMAVYFAVSGQFGGQK